MLARPLPRWPACLTCTGCAYPSPCSVCRYINNHRKQAKLVKEADRDSDLDEDHPG